MSVTCLMHFPPVQMRWCVAVVLAVLQLCSPALQADPLLHISQLEDGQEKPSEPHYDTA